MDCSFHPRTCAERKRRFPFYLLASHEGTRVHRIRSRYSLYLEYSFGVAETPQRTRSLIQNNLCHHNPLHDVCNFFNITFPFLFVINPTNNLSFRHLIIYYDPCQTLEGNGERRILRWGFYKLNQAGWETDKAGAGWGGAEKMASTPSAIRNPLSKKKPVNVTISGSSW